MKLIYELCFKSENHVQNTHTISLSSGQKVPLRTKTSHPASLQREELDSDSIYNVVICRSTVFKAKSKSKNIHTPDLITGQKSPFEGGFRGMFHKVKSKPTIPKQRTFHPASLQREGLDSDLIYNVVRFRSTVFKAKRKFKNTYTTNSSTGQKVPLSRGI
ncbi:hypothetical protein O4H26_06030 [Aequorivita viscosa]|nr:hypothetical protein [Aequorivita viscosa]